VRYLYTHNPFYLIGTLLILVGLQQALGREPTLAGSGILVALLAGYTLLLAAVAAVVIRIGQVWEDARTILLVIVLLFFMLSSGLDVHLLNTPLAGTVLLAAGLLFSLGLSESLLRGLRIELALRYRLPYYLVLVVLFVFPVALAWAHILGWNQFRAWGLFSFPWLASLALLTLLPAARTPPEAEPASGTPWRWPYYPWSLFIFLTIGIAIRSWWLTISFEPAAGSAGCFQPYFLLPLCLVWAALVLEMGLVHGSRLAIAAGCLLPGAGLALSLTGIGHSAVQAEMLTRLTATLGSPGQLAAWSLLGFYVWTWLRGVRAGEGLVLFASGLTAVVDGGTIDWYSFSRPQPLVLAAVAGTVVSLAIAHRSTWRATLGILLVAAGMRYAGVQAGIEGLWFWQWHAPLVALVALPAIFNDWLAKELRELAWRAVPGLAVIAAMVYPWLMPDLTVTMLVGYLAVLFVVSLGLWQRQKETPLLTAALVTLCANGWGQVGYMYAILERTLLAEGLPWLAIGLLVVAAAFAISLLKMGLWQSARQWLDRANLVLGGAPGKA
jgi:hypothetical protein